MTYNTTKLSSAASQGYSSRDSHQPRKNLPSSSNRPPHGISFNLVSLVTKFEALDALSLPFTKTSLHPAPLQVSSKSSPRKGNIRSNYRSRLSTIFSPRRGSPVKHNHEFTEEEVQEVQADVFNSSNSPKITTFEKRLDTGNPRKKQTAFKPSSIRSRDGAEDTTDTVHGKGVGSIAAPYVQNEVLEEKRRGSLREKISFYDGAVSTGDNTRANSSTANMATPTTPVTFPRSRLLDKSYFLTPSTGSSKRTCAQIPDADAGSPTRLRRTSTARQSLKFGSIKKQALESSPAGSFCSNATSQAVKSARKYRDGQDTSPSRVSVQRRRMQGPIREGINATDAMKANAVSGTGGDGSVPPPFAGTDESDKILSQKRVSSKIEELYRTRSLEIKRDNAQGPTKQRGSTANLITESSKGQVLEKMTTESRPGRLAEITRTKVAAMRKLFDGRFSPRSVSPEPCCGLDPILDTIASPPSPPQEQIPEVTAVPPPVPILSPTPSPKSMYILEETESKTLESEQGPGVSERANAWENSMAGTLSSSPTKKLSPIRSRLIEEKMKKFETPSESAQPSRGKLFRRRLSKSLRSIFERKSQEEEPDKSKPPVALANRDRTWSPVPNDSTSKRATIVQRWTKTPTAVSSQGDGTASERESLSENVEFGKMVIKGADCSLRQPRPVRAVEMQRMAHICKDRVGGIMDRDKGGRFSQRRKL